MSFNDIDSVGHSELRVIFDQWSDFSSLLTQSIFSSLHHQRKKVNVFSPERIRIVNVIILYITIVSFGWCDTIAVTRYLKPVVAVAWLNNQTLKCTRGHKRIGRRHPSTLMGMWFFDEFKKWDQMDLGGCQHLWSTSYYFLGRKKEESGIRVKIIREFRRNDRGIVNGKDRIHYERFDV